MITKVQRSLDVLVVGSLERGHVAIWQISTVCTGNFEARDEISMVMLKKVIG
jgi:hypothetical protein